MKLEGTSKEQIQKLESLLPVGKQVHVKLGKHSDTTTLLGVTLATQKAIKEGLGNIPDKVTGPDGKDYTPAVCSITLESCVLDIVLEKIQDVYLLGNGVRLIFAWGTVEIIEAR